MGLNYSGLKNLRIICPIYEGIAYRNRSTSQNLANMVAFPRAIQSLSEWHPIMENLEVPILQALQLHWTR